MPNVAFSSSAKNAVDSYSEHYRDGFENLFGDSGIWSEAQIIGRYVEEAERRKAEIYLALKERLGDAKVIGGKPDGSVTIPWRSRYLLASWEDRGGYRIVTDLEIR